MPGKGKRFTAKQDRQAHHIAASYGGGKRALSIGYATVNKRKGASRRSSSSRTSGRKR
jgi:hypothetical protein